MKILVSDIRVEDRQRKDLGDIDRLVSSIKEFGIIQPIVLLSDFDTKSIRLVAGGRRLESLKKLGVIELEHGKEFIWRDEIIGSEPERIHRRKAIELEENLRRKSLTWQEEILAKQELLRIYQDIYGALLAELQQAQSGKGLRILDSELES
jgi:ParB family chromosome partitioning protein